jgi:hypothetical protein
MPERAALEVVIWVRPDINRIRELCAFERLISKRELEWKMAVYSRLTIQVVRGFPEAIHCHAHKLRINSSGVQSLPSQARGRNRTAALSCCLMDRKAIYQLCCQEG